MAGTAALLAPAATTRSRCAARSTSPGGVDRARPRRARARRRARRASTTRSTRVLEARRRCAARAPRPEIAGYVDALFIVYSLIIIAYIVDQLVFSFGVRAAVLARWSNAVLEFLRDVAEPYLRIFRRFLPTVRPARPDARSSRISRRCGCRRASSSALIRPGEPRRTAGARRALGARLSASSLRSTRPTKALVRSRSRRGEQRDVLPCADVVNTCATRAWRSAVLGGGGGARDRRHRRRAALALVAFFARHTDRPLVWLPTGPAARRRAGQPDRPHPRRAT